MPYITNKREQFLSQGLLLVPGHDGLGQVLQDIGARAGTKGDLNWMITNLIVGRVESLGLSYDTISETLSAVRDAAREAERRLLEPYEDKKLRINLDPYEELAEELRTALHGVNAHESR